LCPNGTLDVYLYSLTLLFPCNTDDPCTSNVTICVDDARHIFTAERLQGGQCLRLPEEARDLIICSLLEGKCPEITVGRYQATLIHDNFRKVFSQLSMPNS
jgi:hypothetical protein